MALSLKDFESDYQHFIVALTMKTDRRQFLLEHIDKHYSHIKNECEEWLENINGGAPQ